MRVEGRDELNRLRRGFVPRQIDDSGLETPLAFGCRETSIVEQLSDRIGRRRRRVGTGADKAQSDERKDTCPDEYRS